MNIKKKQNLMDLRMELLNLNCSNLNLSIWESEFAVSRGKGLPRSSWEAESALCWSPGHLSQAVLLPIFLSNTQHSIPLLAAAALRGFACKLMDPVPF